MIKIVRRDLLMIDSEFEYNEFKDNIIYVKKRNKKKGSEYGVVTLSKDQVELLLQSIELMTSSPDIKPNFSQRIEVYLHPRFTEITEMIYSNKSLENEVKIEMDKNNQKELIKSFDLTSVVGLLQNKIHELEELKKILKNMVFTKYKA